VRITPITFAFLLLASAVLLWIAGYANGGISCSVLYKARTVNGSSLTGFIEHGTKVQVAFGYYACNPVGRGDVVIYDDAGNKNADIKIAKAIGGDRFALALSEGGAKIVVNDEVLKTTTGEPYRLSERAYDLLALYERDYAGVVPEHAVLILGNVAGGSRDSTQFGFVSSVDLLGKVTKIR
jgi:signal peptidase I